MLRTPNVASGPEIEHAAPTGYRADAPVRVHQRIFANRDSRCLRGFHVEHCQTLPAPDAAQ